jgi:hypothetical protein
MVASTGGGSVRGFCLLGWRSAVAARGGGDEHDGGDECLSLQQSAGVIDRFYNINYTVIVL